MSIEQVVVCNFCKRSETYPMNQDHIPLEWFVITSGGFWPVMNRPITFHWCGRCTITADRFAEIWERATSGKRVDADEEDQGGMKYEKRRTGSQ